MADTLQSLMASNKVFLDWCNSILSFLKHVSRDNLLVTGSMERPRQMEVWRTGGDKLTLEGLLRGEELSSVASVLAIHPTRSLSFLMLLFSKKDRGTKKLLHHNSFCRDAVVGGNSSGRLHLFMWSLDPSDPLILHPWEHRLLLYIHMQTTKCYNHQHLFMWCLDPACL